MIPADDEVRLRAALADLTSDQPPAPASRYSAIRRKAAARRRHQFITAVAVLAGAAVLAAVTVHDRLGAPGPVAPAHHGTRPSKHPLPMMSGLPMPAGT